MNSLKFAKIKKSIQNDLVKIRNGYVSEKDNAYYLNFASKDNKRHYLLHDIRIEHNGRVAHIDHIIISRLGIELLESKSFSGILTINQDGSLSADYSNTFLYLTCKTERCKPKLRKKKLKFYKVCDICKTEELFFENKPS